VRAESPEARRRADAPALQLRTDVPEARLRADEKPWPDSVGAPQTGEVLKEGKTWTCLTGVLYPTTMIES
jgi:hypothetical protein